MTRAAEWAERVKQWQGSGQQSREFCDGRGYAAKNLLWWSSHFRRHGLPDSAKAKGGGVRLARVVRRRERKPVTALGVQASAVVVELSGARVQIEPGSDRATVAMVLEILHAAAMQGGGQ
jgi:hypothetical protein